MRGYETGNSGENSDDSFTEMRVYVRVCVCVRACVRAFNDRRGRVTTAGRERQGRSRCKEFDKSI